MSCVRADSNEVDLIRPVAGSIFKDGTTPTPGPMSKCTAYPHSHLCGLQLRCTSERNAPFLDPCRENVFPSAGREEAGLVEECHAACRQPTRASAEAGWNEIAI